MTYQKCPRCNLNYISEGENLCRICDQELRRGASLKSDDEEDICPLCGENVVAKGKDLCTACLREHMVTATAKSTEQWSYTAEQDSETGDEQPQNSLPLIPQDLDDEMDDEEIDSDTD